MILKNKEYNSVLFIAGKTICYLVIITGFFGVTIFSIDLGSFTLFPFRIFLFLLWILFLGHTLFNKGKIDFLKNKIQWYFIFLAFWVGYTLLSLAWSASLSLAIRNIFFLLMGISVIFFSIYYFKKVEDLQKVQWIWFVIFSVLVILGFWEHLTGHHLMISKFYLSTNENIMFIPTGVFHNENNYATFLVLGIPFVISLFRDDDRILFRFLGIETVAGAIYLIVVTGSRANILAVLLELTIFLLLIDKKQRIKLIFTLLICLVILIIFLPNSMQGFFPTISRETSLTVSQTKLNSGSLFQRINLIRNGIYFLFSKAGFGVGAGNFEYYMSNFAIYDTEGYINPTNWWLEILVNYGIFVFVGYIIFYLSIIWKLRKIYYKKLSRNEKIICEGLLVSLIGFSFASISPSSMIVFRPQWLLFAFALTYLNYILNKEETQVLL
jgi:teichuronic acid biosynthesis protein TuaE